MSRKLNGGGRERASQVPDLHFNICNFGPKSAFFLPKTAVEPAKNGQMKGNSGYSTLKLLYTAPLSGHGLTQMGRNNVSCVGPVSRLKQRGFGEAQDVCIRSKKG